MGVIAELRNQNRGLYLSGYSQHVEIATALSITNQYTFEVAFTPSNLTEPAGSESQTHGFTLAANSPTGSVGTYPIWLSVREGAVVMRAFSATTAGRTITAPEVTVGKRCKISVTAISGGECKVYVNGILKDTFISGTVSSWSAGGFTLGDLRPGRLIPYYGQYHEVVLWNTVRTPEEIAHRLSGVGYSEPGLVGYWLINEDSGTTVNDLSGNGNHGTIIGAKRVSVKEPSYAIYDTGVYYGTNGHPTTEAQLDAYFNTTNVTLIKAGLHQGPVSWAMGGELGLRRLPYYNISDTTYSWMLEGYIYVPTDGTYGFQITGDDAVDLQLDGTTICSWYGSHGFSGAPANATNSIVLTAGMHKFRTRVAQGAGGAGYALYWKRPGEASFSFIPQEYIYGLGAEQSIANWGDKTNFMLQGEVMEGVIKKWKATDLNSGTGVNLTDSTAVGGRARVGQTGASTNNSLLTFGPYEKNYTFEQDYIAMWRMKVSDNTIASNVAHVKVYDNRTSSTGAVQSWGSSALYIKGTDFAKSNEWQWFSHRFNVPTPALMPLNGGSGRGLELYTTFLEAGVDVYVDEIMLTDPLNRVASSPFEMDMWGMSPTDFNEDPRPLNDKARPGGAIDGSFESCTIVKNMGDPAKGNGSAPTGTGISVGGSWNCALHNSPATEYCEVVDVPDGVDGNRVFRISGGATWKSFNGAAFTYLSTKWYRISVYVRVTEGHGVKSCETYIPHFNDPAMDQKKILDAATLADGKWKRLYNIFKPSTSKSGAIYLYGHIGAGTIEYDGFMIEEFDTEPTGAPPSLEKGMHVSPDGTLTLIGGEIVEGVTF